MKSEVKVDKKIIADTEINKFLSLVKRGLYFEVYLELSHKGYLVDCQDTMGQTGLHWASKRGDYHMVEILLYFGANVNIVDIL